MTRTNAFDLPLLPVFDDDIPIHPEALPIGTLWLPVERP
jgi:hypothetical protein